MTTEIRPVEREELSEFKRIVSLSLAMPVERFADMQPEWTLCAFEDGQLATCYAAWPFSMRLNGAPVPVSAVTTVSTLPVYRRRGHLRAIMGADFQRLYEGNGPPLAVLYASLAAIYQRYGYAVVSTHGSYRVEPRYLAFAVPAAVRGTLREVTRDDSALLNELYRRFAYPRTGYLHRSRAIWAAGVLADPAAGQTLSLLVYEEDGEPLGFLAYTTGAGEGAGPGPSHTLNVRDLVWLTPAAYRAFWEHLGRFDLVRDVVWETVPIDDPLPHLLLEPRMLRPSARDGILGRIVDVARALTARPYVGADAITLTVQDDLCPWNAGRWQFEAAGVESRIQRTTSEPDLTLPVSTLAMLLFGQLSASAAASMGRLDAHDPAALARWDALFATHHRPFCADHF